MNAFLLLPEIVAQENDSTKWDVDAAHGPVTEVRFTTDEGTWMSVDISPDGQTLVFDLLGDLYLLPVTGGKARPITSGPAFDVQPRFYPDGSRISFTSDRAGGDNIWTISVDGDDPKQISRETFRLLNGAEWTPDGQYLIARKHFTSTRSLGAGEMWMFHHSGGSGLQLTTKKNDQQDQGNEIAVSPGMSIFLKTCPGDQRFNTTRTRTPVFMPYADWIGRRAKLKHLFQVPAGPLVPYLRRMGARSPLCAGFVGKVCSTVTT